MRTQNPLRKASGLEQRETEQYCVPHASPDRVGNIRPNHDIANQRGVDRNADQDEKRLQAERAKGFEVILPHAAAFAVHHRRHRNRRDGCDKVDFNHPAECDEENANAHRFHAESDEE